MERLRTSPASRPLLVIFLVATAAALLLMARLRVYDAQMLALGHGIVAFELTYGAQTAADILAAWGPDGQAAAQSSTRLDFAFIPAYALAFAGLTLLLARRQREGWQTLGLWLTGAPLLAGALDVVENLFLLGMLNRPADFPALYALMASVAATAKFGLLVVCLVYWLALALRSVAGRLRPLQPQR